jgi:hypothetical protein
MERAMDDSTGQPAETKSADTPSAPHADRAAWTERRSGAADRRQPLVVERLRVTRQRRRLVEEQIAALKRDAAVLDAEIAALDAEMQAWPDDRRVGGSPGRRWYDRLDKLPFD